MIYGRAGRVLWLGRNQRLGNAAQRLAVAVRDGGCFECGAPMHQCELHHIQNGTATADPPTSTTWSPSAAATTNGWKPTTSQSAEPPAATAPDPEPARTPRKPGCPLSVVRR